MARPRSPRGPAGGGVQLPSLRVSQAESEWLAKLAAQRKQPVAKVQRDLTFATMPGYKP